MDLQDSTLNQPTGDEALQVSLLWVKLFKTQSTVAEALQELVYYG